MKTILLVTVGTGRSREDIAGGIVKAIGLSPKHDEIVYVVSEKSKAETLPLIQKQIPGGEVCLISKEDSMETTELEIINYLKKKGEIKLITLYTSGTKDMSIASVLATLALGSNTFVEILGERRDEGGRVVPGSENIVSWHSRVVGIEHLRMARKLFNLGEYEGARELAKLAEDNLLDENMRKDARLLRERSRFYALWERFEHKEALNTLEEACKVLSDSRGLRFSKRTYETYLAHLRELASGAAEGRPTQGLLVDLFANAERRMREGRSEDALARLYRFIEALAQWRLMSAHNIDTSMDEETHGLERAYKKLKSLGDELGARYEELVDELRKVMNARNTSIIAHGFRPIRPEELNRFREIALSFARSIIPDIEARVASIEFVKEAETI